MNAPTLTESAVWNALRGVVDPELDCNIVELGLVYGVAIDGARVRVTMTLTTPGCPMHESLCTGVQMALLNLEGVEQAEVELVWDPPWHPGRMSDAARTQLHARGAGGGPAPRPRITTRLQPHRDTHCDAAARAAPGTRLAPRVGSCAPECLQFIRLAPLRSVAEHPASHLATAQ